MNRYSSSGERTNPSHSDIPDPYQTRTLNPGDVIEVYHNQDDNQTVLTDLQTIEYKLGQRTLFPSAAAQDMSSSDSDDHKLPPLNPIMEDDGRSISYPASNPMFYDSDNDKKIPAKGNKMIKSTHVPDPNRKSQLDEEIAAMPSRPPQNQQSTL